MKIKNFLYNKEVELVFESFRHEYTDANGKVPSVTTILSIIAKPALISWAANSAVDYIADQIKPGVSLDELQLQAIFEAGRKNHFQKKVDAGTIGSFVHKWVEQYIKGENPPAPVNEGLQNSINQFLGWVAKHKVKFLVSEQVIFSKKFRFTGTLDFICEIDGKMYVGDLKTSSGIYPEYLIQTAAYRYAREEEFPKEKFEGQLIVRIGKEGDFEFAMIRDNLRYNQMLVGFLSALKLWQSMERLKTYSPEKE